MPFFVADLRSPQYHVLWVYKFVPVYDGKIPRTPNLTAKSKWKCNRIGI